MICPKCLKREANVFFSRNINGKKEEFKVCEVCAKEMGLFGSPDLLLDMSDLISGFMGKGIAPSLTADTICPACGMSLSEFSKNSKVGCSSCYDTFEKYLDPIIKRIHGSTRHTGKMPEEADEKIKKQRDIEGLKEKLKSAVMAEDFESAAIYRDKIKELEGGI